MDPSKVSSIAHNYHSLRVLLAKKPDRRAHKRIMRIII